MMDTRVLTDIVALNSRKQEELHWLTRLREEKVMKIPESGFPLEYAILLFNQDYADLSFGNRSVIIAIAPAGIAVLRSRGVLKR